MNNNYKIEKHIWSETDYNEMGWHDNTVYSMAFDEDKYELMFDLDYILNG